MKLAGIVLVAALALTGCGGGSGSTSSAEDAAKNAKPYVAPSTTPTTASPCDAYNSAVDRWNALTQAERDKYHGGLTLGLGFSRWAKAHHLPFDQAACGAASTSTSSTAVSITTVPKSKGDAVAIAKRLGCVNPKADPDDSSIDLGVPNPIENVTCVASGTEFRVNVYASPADLGRVFSTAGRVIMCSFFTGFGITDPVYVVNGADFSAEAADPLADDTSGVTKMGTRSQAEALGRALDLPVTTIDCG